MRNPRDYLHAQIRVGSKCCEIVDGENQPFMRTFGTSDMAAIRNMQALVDAMIEDRKPKEEPCSST
jgi:hypothetical protein